MDRDLTEEVESALVDVQHDARRARVMPLLLEGIRRHDELKQSIALAPDHLW